MLTPKRIMGVGLKLGNSIIVEGGGGVNKNLIMGGGVVCNSITGEWGGGKKIFSPAPP